MGRNEEIYIPDRENTCTFAGEREVVVEEEIGIDEQRMETEGAEGERDEEEEGEEGEKRIGEGKTGGSVF